MSNTSANKNSQIPEYGDMQNGYFAKEYARAFQIFGPNNSMYLKIYKTSNENCLKKVQHILDLLNKNFHKKDATEKVDRAIIEGKLQSANAKCEELRKFSNLCMEQEQVARKRVVYRDSEITFLRDTVRNLSTTLSNFSKK